MLRRLWLPRLLARRLGPWTWALLVLDGYRLYRRLPPARRQALEKRLQEQARKLAERRRGERD